MNQEMALAAPRFGGSALPEAAIADEIGEGLYDSTRDYIEQIDAYKQFQGKVSEEGVPMERIDAEELREVIQAHEPGVVVELSKPWFSRHWRVFVIRDGQRYESLGVYHYWLERALVKTFCRPLGE